jgi:DNA-3-methyladenine glycosylase II
MDYSTAIAHLKHSDPVLAAWIERLGNCRLDQAQRQGDVLATLCQSIIYQQLSTKAAKAIHQRFLLLYPEALSAQAILQTADEKLRETGISRSKITYLKDLAQKVLDGLPTLAELETWEDETIVESLTQVKGIGCWTVQMLLIFRLHRWDVLPVDDLGIRSGIRHLYGLADLPNRKQVEQIGACWMPYRSIASWYLWRSLDFKEKVS